jgi:FMN phosphatase YigB (HAD superfamily)
MSNQESNPSQPFIPDTSQSSSFQQSDDDTSKWEKMYFSSGPQTQQFQFQTPDNASTSKPTVSDVRIITFDLDNTLWRTSPTISYANKILNQHMQTLGVASGSLVEVEMGKLFEANKKLYAGGNYIEEDDYNTSEKKEEELASEVMNVGETKEDDSVIGGNVQDDLVHIRAESRKKKIQPVYLTMLRKDAIRSLLQHGTASPMDTDLIEEEVNRAFQLWMNARTESITQNYAENVLQTLSKLRSSIIPHSKLFDKLYIGAITDGNSDPMSVPSIGEFFDFVIRAEDVGVSKPDGKVYKAAVAELMVTLMRDGNSIENFFLGESNDDMLGYGSAAYMKPSASSWNDIDQETVDAFAEAVGPWWVHIGDDFFKDVVASKGFTMRSVWVRELIAKQQNLNASNEADTQQNERRSVQDLENEIAKQNGVLKMAIGESEFLANTLHEEFSDAILERFDELSDLLIGWHDEGLREQAANDSIRSNNEPSLTAPSVLETPQEVDGQPKDFITNNDETDSAAAKIKFCVFCGEQLPPVAKFCSGCGERQP